MSSRKRARVTITADVEQWKTVITAMALGWDAVNRNKTSGYLEDEKGFQMMEEIDEMGVHISVCIEPFERPQKESKKK